jgi:ubiquinone/menaquinone biosynthesis C-methylase UbiE
MSFYRDRILPFLVHLAMRQENLAPYRRRIVTAAEGRVLEIGIGSGLNLPLYTDRVERLIGLDPSQKLLHWAREREAVAPVDLVEGSAESIPLDSHSIDTVVTTWTLCSIPDAHRAMAEMRRVLRPTGRLLFVEHGQSTDGTVRRWQDRLTPAWKCLGGGCHLNRPISRLIESSGFRIDQMQTGYAKGPRPMTFMYEGVARPA